MKIAFFIAYEISPYAGVVRPFINWSKKLSEDHEIYFLLLNCDKKLVNFVKRMIIKNQITTEVFNELTRFIEIIKPDILITDDFIARLKILQRIKDKVSIKTCIYAQVLFGMHSITEIYSPISLKERVLFTFTHFIPFNVLKMQYKKLLQKQDIIIANSGITATLLHTLYGVEPHGIVYPPVDTEVFKPQNVKKKNQVLLYLGTHAGDTDVKFVREICKILKNRDMKIFKIYSECKLTICPQKWETFGYVVAESIACGTPVMAYNIMGISEIGKETDMVFLANNKTEFFVEHLEEHVNNFRVRDMCMDINHLPWGMEKSTNHFLRVLRSNLSLL